MEMLEENIKIAEKATANSLLEHELELIEKIGNKINELNKINCTGCNYCMPCPYGVRIPDCFKIYNEKYLFEKKVYGFDYATAWYIFDLMGLNGKSNDASLCKECGLCVSKCPQHINIPENLNDVNKTFHSRIFKPLIPLIRRLSKII